MQQRAPVRITLFLFLLFALAYGLLSGVKHKYSRSEMEEAVQFRVNQQLNRSDEEHKRFYELLANQKGIIDFKGLVKIPEITTLIYRNGILVYWDDNNLSPPELWNRPARYLGLIEENGNKFILNSKAFVSPAYSFLVVHAIKIYSRYPISNQYVQSGPNKRIFGEFDFYIGSNPGENFKEISFDGRTLFFVQVKSKLQNLLGDQALAMLLAHAFIFTWIGVFLIRFAFSTHSFISRITVLLLGLILLRAIMISLYFPMSWVQIPLFDPKYYAGSDINPTLGDLLINLLLIGIILYCGLRELLSFQTGEKIIVNKWTIRVLWMISLFGFLSIGIILYEILYSIAIDSKPNLDITLELNYKPIKLLLKSIFIPVMILFLMSLKIVAGIWDVLKSNTKVVDKWFFYAFYLIILLGAYFFQPNWFWVLLTGVVLLVFINSFGWPGGFDFFSFKTYVFYFLAGLAVSIFAALAITKASLARERYEKQKFAENILSENDIITEFYLNDTRQSIQKDAFITNRFLYPRIRKDLIEGKIKRVHLPAYFNKYDLHISVFDPAGNPLPESEIKQNYFEFLNKIRVLDSYTAFEDVYYLNLPSIDQGKRFYCACPILLKNNVIGYLMLELRISARKVDNVYPELLIDERLSIPRKSSSFSYGLFQNSQLSFMTDGFKVEPWVAADWLKDTSLFAEGVVYKDQHYFGVKGADGEAIIVTSRLEISNSYFSNFSLYMFVWILLLFVLLVLSGIFYYAKGLPFNFSTRIQLYLNVYFLLPTLILGVFTIWIVANNYRKDLVDSFRKRADVIARDFEISLQEYLDGQKNVFQLEEKLSKIAFYNKCDINLYNTSGRLLLTTEPLLQRYGLHSSLLSSNAFLSIVSYGMPDIVQKEQIGNLNYFSVYLPLRSSQTGSILGIISIPFFDATEEYERELIKVISNVLNLYAIIFLVFALASFLITSNLLQPFRLIGGTLRTTSLEGKNLPLSWPIKDEIGKLVEEYNRMIVNLSESKALLAKTEKESAWREMAQQVAHEIKNPLTPMKLKLQTLQRMLIHNAPDTKARTMETIQVLLDQIENLEHIASSFYDFARMPAVQSQVLDLSQIVENTSALYNIEDKSSVLISVESKPMWVYGDPKLIGQMLSNLLINALQSVPEGRKPTIHVSLYKKNPHTILVSVADNGSGIPETIQGKVFQPNFSTKYSGSGLGLALSKKWMESMGGTIYFATEANAGSTFYLEFPLHHV